MKNPFGWLFGFAWMIAVKAHIRLHPAGGHLWMPQWVQPYWMKCMGFEVKR